MVEVFHNKDFLAIQFKKPTEIPAENLTKVAEVDINDLETAFELTNNIDHPWTMNERVTPLKNNPRSTSVGDVMKIDDHYYLVAAIGFTEIKIVE